MRKDIDYIMCIDENGSSNNLIYVLKQILNEIKQYSGKAKHVMMAKQAVNQIARVLRHQMISSHYYHPKMWWCVFHELVRARALFSKPNK